MGSASVTGDVRRPRQARSRASYRRLVDAAKAVLGAKPFDEATVAEIAERAGLTVGAFYARFSDKEALLRHLEDDLFAATRTVVAGVTARAAAGEPAEALLTELVSAHARLYRSHRSVARALVVRAQTDPALGARLRELSRENFARVARALSASGTIRHPEPRVALEFVLYSERSILREAILFGEGWGKERRWSEARIVGETVRLILRYLGLPEPGARRRSAGRRRAGR
jgi:AcrR family transcriptional regulator